MDATEIIMDTLEMIADAPVDVVWNGATYEFSRGALARTKPLEVGGFMDLPDLSLFTTLKKLSNGVLVDRFASLPEPNQHVTMGASSYRIQRVITDEFSSAIQIDLATDDQ